MNCRHRKSPPLHDLNCVVSSHGRVPLDAFSFPRLPPQLQLTHTSHFPVRSPLRNLPPPTLPLTKLRLGGADFNMGSFAGSMGTQLGALTGLEDLELYRMPIIPDSLSVLFMLTRMTSLSIIECRRLSHYSQAAAVGHDMLTLETVRKRGSDSVWTCVHRRLKV